jgi:hypothetical protein
MVHDNVCTKSYWVRKFELVGVGGGYPGLCRRLINLSLNFDINLVT